jgi:hypothetical protein
LCFVTSDIQGSGVKRTGILWRYENILKADGVGKRLRLKLVTLICNSSYITLSMEHGAWLGYSDMLISYQKIATILMIHISCRTSLQYYISLLLASDLHNLVHHKRALHATMTLTSLCLDQIEWMVSSARAISKSQGTSQTSILSIKIAPKLILRCT